MVETVQQHVRTHDRYQAEFRLDYALLPGKQTHYRITTYLFVPHSLAIRQDTYPKSDFYRDIQNYVRLKIPVYPLDELVGSADSPLTKWSHSLADDRTRNRGGGNNRASAKAVIDRLKYVRVILKASLQREVAGARRAYAKGLPDDTSVRQLGKNLLHAIERARGALAQFRSQRALVSTSQVDAAIRNAYHLTDEAISLVMEEFLIDIFRLTNRPGCELIREEVQAGVNQSLQSEVQYRSTAGFRASLRHDGEEEKYLFRVSALKKYTSSVLYLSLAIQREGAAIEQVLFALAAGLSMIFATMVAFFFQQRYGNYAFPFFIALVVGYMFKDRIKETTRALFSIYLRRHFFDRRLIIRPPNSKHQLGYLREKMVFIAKRDVPPYLIVKRNQALVSNLENEGQDESVLCYTKEVVLQPNAFRDLETGGPTLNGITDIMRFDLRPYLRKMDDPVERRFFLQDGKLHVERCPKVYYLNVLTTYTTGNQSKLERLEHTRIVLTRKGIRRIEQIG